MFAPCYVYHRVITVIIFPKFINKQFIYLINQPDAYVKRRLETALRLIGEDAVSLLWGNDIAPLQNDFRNR